MSIVKIAILVGGINIILLKPYGKSDRANRFATQQV